MSSALVTLMMTALILLGVSIIAETSLGAVDTLSGSWKAMEARSSAMVRTDVRAIATDVSGQTLTVTLRNTGSEPLSGFEHWDLIAQYYTPAGVYRIEWLTYVQGGLSAYEWRVESIYLDAEDDHGEVHQPGILDPSEELVIEARLSPAARGTNDNLLVLSTPNGVTVSTPF